MKILQISSAQSLGGGERHLADLANGLTAAGHEVYVAVRPGSPLIGELSRIPKKNLRAFSLRNSLDAKSARDLAKLVREEQIQIVHAHMARDYPLAAYAARRSLNARLIVTRHVLFPLNRLHRITLSHASSVIAVSSAVAAQLNTDRLVSPEKISLVVNGIDTSRFANAREKFDRKAFLRRWTLPEDSLVVGMVGELSPLKGQREFLLAANEIIKEVPKAFFIIAGIDHSRDKHNRAGCEDLINRLNLRERVKLVGWLDNLDQLYCGLDIFVSASHTESFGLAIAEAMASRTTVVATETEGAKEIIQQGETGVLVPVSDDEQLTRSIVRLLKDENSRQRIGLAAQQSVVSRFGIERMIRETEEIYRVALEAAHR